MFLLFKVCYILSEKGKMLCLNNCDTFKASARWQCCSYLFYCRRGMYEGEKLSKHNVVQYCLFLCVFIVLIPNITPTMCRGSAPCAVWSRCFGATQIMHSHKCDHVKFLLSYSQKMVTVVHVGQGRKAQVNNIHDPWALRWHCVRNRYAAVLNIATWAQEYFRKPLSCTTVCKKWRNATWISVTLGESSTSILCSDVAGFSEPEIISDKSKMSAVLKWVHISTCLWKKMDLEFSFSKKRTIHQQQRQNQTSVMAWECSRANIMGD